MEEILMIFLEQILEAIYFSMFLIIVKNIKSKRILFTLIMIFEYLALKHFIKLSVWFQLIYTFMSYVNLKVFYKEEAHITDVFLFAFASIILIIASVSSYILINFTIKEYLAALLLNRIIIFCFLCLSKNKIRILYKEFCSLWNRHKIPNKIKSLTLRNISIILFNLLFWTINFGMVIALTYG